MGAKNLTEKDTEHVAMLARISLSPEEIKSYTQQLNNIVDFFKKLEELDTSDVEPTYHILDLVNVTRPDEVTPSLAREDALANAPRKQNNYFKAPKIN
ncbi:MAG TPA: Asp-tRNA(Asn)/Glu-tRNA(Gln) amidotransferase subunit GatC [Candidatus Lokiarchaeia archaeon]|nr:Asp-tRNA(Asn)/Glu-tRNA(Gln) amidotransferase subunit GatC [Candidatus Lokiarchaeia archaeon]